MADYLFEIISLIFFSTRNNNKLKSNKKIKVWNVDSGLGGKFRKHHQKAPKRRVVKYA